MKTVGALVVLGILALMPQVSDAQVAGSAKLGVATQEMSMVALGWSAKKQVIGQTVYNESNEKVGVIDDLIIAPDRAVSFAIIGAVTLLSLFWYVRLPANAGDEMNNRAQPRRIGA